MGTSKKSAKDDARPEVASSDEQSERYHILFETMGQGVVHQDAAGKVISMNPAAEEILGKTSAEFLGQTSTGVERDCIREDGSIFPGSEHPAMVALRTGKRILDVPMGVYNPRENRYRWISINAIPVFREGATTPYEVYTIFKDFTEQQIHEVELRKSEGKYRSVVESSPYGMHFYELRDDGNLIFTGANRSASRILKIDHSALMGKTIEEAFPGLVETDIIDTYKRVARTGESWNSERVGYHEGAISGAFNVFAFQIAPGSMAVAFLDITERIRSEEEARALMRSVKEEKDRLEALIRSMSDEVWFAGKDGKFILANPSAMKAFKVDPASDPVQVEELARNLEVFSADGTPRAPGMAPPLRALAGETVRNEEEMIRIPETGQLRFRQVTATPVIDENGEVLGSVSVVRDITEKKRAADALRSTSEYLEKLFTYANAPIIVWDTSFKITRFNKAFERMTGYSSDEVIGKDLGMLFPADSKEESLEMIAATLSGERWESVEIPIRRSDGKVRVALWNSANVYQEDGKTLAATIAQGQDITERKDAEAAIQEYMRILERSNEDLEMAKGRLEALISLMPVGILITDTSGKFMTINDSLKHIWGGEIPAAADFEGYREFKAWTVDTGKVVGPKDWPIYKAMADGASAPEQIFDIERLDGSRGTIICSAIPLFDASGRIVAGAAFAQDISELRETERILREEKNKLQFILDSLPVAVGLYDVNGRRILGNSQVDRIWHGEMLPTNSKADFDKFTGYDSKTGVRLRSSDWPVSKVLETGKPVHSQEIDIVRLDRTTATILASAVPARDESGRTTGALIAYIDISSQKEVEKDLARSNTELQSFAYAASHDLREPLRTISGFLEILQMDYGDRLDSEAKDHIQRAIGASGRLHMMIDDLLSYSRLETRKKPFRPVNLNETLSEALGDLNKTLTEHGAVVTSDPLPTVWADDHQMAIVFRNMIDNGIKFHRKEPPKVRITAKKKGDEWLLCFQDNGIGIDERFYGKVFDMFTRLHSRAEYPGTGIGLAMVKKIVERHGGRIWVESVVGKGSSFYITIGDMSQVAHHSPTIESWTGFSTPSAGQHNVSGQQDKR